MSETVSELRIATKGLIFEIRCWFCEELIGWALKVSPKGYTPSFVELLVEERLRSVEMCRNR